jgi:hypothetical protein
MEEGEMRMNKRMKTIAGSLLCMLLVILTGCSAIGGLNNVDQVLTNAVNVQSYEGNGSLSIEFPKDSAAKPLKIGDVELSSLGKIDLVVTSMKQPEPNKLSLTGKVNLMNKEIPFSLQLNKAQLSILLDNNSKPIVFNLDTMIGESVQVSGINVSPIFAEPNQLLSLLSPFVIKQLPNLTNVNVSTVNEKINEESLDLQKVHVELNSAEAIDFAKKLLKNIAADPAGVKALISQLYKAFFATSEVKAGETDFSAIIIDGAANVIVEQLSKLADSLDSTDSTGVLSSLLNDKTSIKTDLYLDGSAQLRKLAMDLNLGGTIKAAGSMQFWKVNQAVSPDPAIAIPSDAFKWEGNSKMAHLLKSLDKSSATYQLLLNDLHVMSKEIKMILPPYDKSGKVAVGSPYISKTDRTMVPVRYVSETLDAEVTWDDKKKQATIIDILSGKIIVLTLGSNKATVDGKVMDLDSPATLTNGSTYVPVGFIVQSLGAELGWDKATRTVSISKK